MLAYFHKGIFVAFWQNQMDQQGWFESTVAAMGHRPQDVEVFLCDAMRNDQSFYFDDQRRLVVGHKTPVEIEGDTVLVNAWNDPVELQKVFPR